MLWDITALDRFKNKFFLAIPMEPKYQWNLSVLEKIIPLLQEAYRRKDEE